MAAIDIANGPSHQVRLTEDPAQMASTHAASANDADAELIAWRNAGLPAEDVRGNEIGGCQASSRRRWQSCAENHAEYVLGRVPLDGSPGERQKSVRASLTAVPSICPLKLHAATIFGSPVSGHITEFPRIPALVRQLLEGTKSCV